MFEYINGAVRNWTILTILTQCYLLNEAFEYTLQENAKKIKIEAFLYLNINVPK